MTATTPRIDTIETKVNNTQAVAKFSLTGNQSVSNDAFTLVIFNQVDFDDDSIGYDTTTGIFTAPEDGVWEFRVSFNAAGAGFTDARAEFVNDSNTRLSSGLIAGLPAVHANIYSLSSGDEVKARANIDASSPSVISNTNTFLTIRRIR